MPHTPQALVFPPLQRTAPPSARVAEAEQFEHAAEAIRPSWPALPKPSAARPALVRGSDSALAPSLSPFDAPRAGEEAAPSFAPRPFDAGELEENPFKRPQRRRGWQAALLVIAAVALGWALLRGSAPSSAPTAAPAAATPAAHAPAASAPAAQEPAPAPTPPSAQVPREAPASAEVPQESTAAAPIEAAPAPKATRPLQAKQRAPMAPAKSAPAKAQSSKPVARPVAPRAAPSAPRVAPVQPAPSSFAPRRHQSAPIQTNPYD